VPIPIRNIYYLLLYAWNRLEEADDALVSGLESTQLAELFGRVLHSSLRTLFRRGLDRAYSSRTEQMVGVRGRIELTPTLLHDLIRRGEAVCTYDELTADSLPNRIVKAAAEHIGRVKGLDGAVTDQMRECVAMLRQVRSVPLTSQLCQSAQLNQNITGYRLPISIAHLIATESLVDEETGDTVFRDFDRTSGPLYELFQEFAKNFLDREQSIFRVRSPHIRWASLIAQPDTAAYVPEMWTDIVLEREGYAAIIDAKFYAVPMRERSGKRKIESHNMYQLYSYVSNLAAERDVVDGALLYAQVGEGVDIEFQLQRHRFRVMTLDLSVQWEEIHNSLKDLVRWADAAAA
jgi:5-methylcytosine-specific restriction enzyme subunit McrC